VHQPIDQFGGVAADLLFAAIDGTSHSIDPVLPTTLVVRETT
jgi:DNA-binding LacI/PurR family transcriptional regulator